MLVKRKTDGKEFNVEKDSKGMYGIEGAVFDAEEMKVKFEIVKAKKITKKEEGNMDELIAETNQSDTLGKLALALSKAQNEFSGVVKSSEGYGYNFADLNAVIQSSAPIFTKYELAITQNIITRQIGKVFYAGVKTTLLHSSGEWMSTESYIPTERSKQNPLVQMFGVSSTYIRRYQYQAIIGLATTDNDGAE